MVGLVSGIAAATGKHVDQVRRVMWLGELTRGGCSMFGAWGEATKTRDGRLLQVRPSLPCHHTALTHVPLLSCLRQLRALDWDTDGPFRNYHLLVVYHPTPDPTGRTQPGHPWVNLAFAGFTAEVGTRCSSY